jgi:hypothetical protein
MVTVYLIVIPSLKNDTRSIFSYRTTIPDID